MYVYDSPVGQTPLLRERIAHRAARVIAGYDYFISYGRRDATTYATKLENALRKQGHSVFRDATRMGPGEPLTAALRRALRRSEVLIVICTEAALGSKHVAEEVRLFAETGRRILPLNMSQTLQRLAPEHWGQAHLASRVWIDVDASAVEVAPATLDAIKAGRAVPRTRRTRRALALGLSCLIAAGAGGAAWKIISGEHALDTTIQDLGRMSYANAEARHAREMFDIQAKIKQARESLGMAGQEWAGRHLLLQQRARLIRGKVARESHDEIDAATWNLLDQVLASANHGVRIQLRNRERSYSQARLLEEEGLLVVLEQFDALGTDAAARFYDTRDGSQVREVNGAIGSVAPLVGVGSPRRDARYVAAFDDGRVLLKEADRLVVEKSVGLVDHHRGFPTYRKLSLDGRRLLLLWQTPEQNRFEVHDIPAGSVIDEGELPDGSGSDPRFVVFGATIPALFVVFEGEPHVCRKDPGHPRWSESKDFHGLRDVAPTPDGQSLVLVGENHEPVVLKANLKSSKPLIDRMYGMQRVAIFPNAPQYFVTVGGVEKDSAIVDRDCTVRIWEPGRAGYDAREAAILDCPEPAVAVSQHGTRFAYGRPGLPLVVQELSGLARVAELGHLVTPNDANDASEGDFSLQLGSFGNTLLIHMRHDVLLIDVPPYQPAPDVGAELAILCARMREQRLVQISKEDLNDGCR
jgi:hypothetical protein